MRCSTKARARAAEQTTRERETSIRLLLDTSLDAVITMDADGTITGWNVQAEPMFGWTKGEAIGQPAAALLMPADFRETFDCGLRRFLETGDSTPLNRRVEVSLMRRDGGEIPTELTVAPIPVGTSYLFSMFVRDVTERKQAEDRVQRMAQHDALTNLPNRALLRDRLEQAIAQARRRQTLVALLFVDLDRFKLVNDSLGHDAGDQLLVVAAERLRGCVREEDTVARLGGDEFILVLPDLQAPKSAVRVAEKVLQAFAQPILAKERWVCTPASIGIALFPTDSEDDATMTTHADIAMYKAKQQGGNTFQFFTPDLQEAVQERMLMDHLLRQALERGEFELHYQPVFDLAARSFTKLEALIRWRAPDGSTVPPARFIPVAEETGLIVRLGEWVLRTACAQVKAWHNVGWPGLNVAVNVSGRQLKEPEFPGRLSQILCETQLPPECLDLELTENMFLQDATTTTAMLRSLKSLGVRLAIDDFGTGYSSLDYLRRFPIDTLKIDQSFVRDLAKNPDDAAIVETILAIAKTLKLTVVAEGVEQDAQLAFLDARQCRSIQGYLFSRPVPPDRIPSLLRGPVPSARTRLLSEKTLPTDDRPPAPH